MGRKKAKDAAFRTGTSARLLTTGTTELDDGDLFIGQKLLDILDAEAEASTPSASISTQSPAADTPTPLRRSNRLRAMQVNAEKSEALAFRPAQQQQEGSMQAQVRPDTFQAADAQSTIPPWRTNAHPANNSGGLWSIHNQYWRSGLGALSSAEGYQGLDIRPPIAPRAMAQGYEISKHSGSMTANGTLGSADSFRQASGWATGNIDGSPNGYSTNLHPSPVMPLDTVVFKGRPTGQRQPDIAKEPMRYERTILPHPKSSLAPPKPTHAYMQQALLTDLRQLPEPQPILVIIDLNGTLVHRADRKSSANFLRRPFVNPFLKYVFSRFTVMVWSSARPENVDLMCKGLFDAKQRSQLAAIWARDRLGLTQNQYYAKVQVYKRLDQVWNDPNIAKSHPNRAAGGKWNQRNTVLLDDSAQKARAQPFNLVQISEFVGVQNQSDANILRQVAGYLDVLRYQQDVSAFIRRKPFKANAGWDRPWPSADLADSSAE